MYWLTLISGPRKRKQTWCKHVYPSNHKVSRNFPLVVPTLRKANFSLTMKTSHILTSEPKRKWTEKTLRTLFHYSHHKKSKRRNASFFACVSVFFVYISNTRIFTSNANKHTYIFINFHKHTKLHVDNFLHVNPTHQIFLVVTLILQDLSILLQWISFDTHHWTANGFATALTYGDWTGQNIINLWTQLVPFMKNILTFSTNVNPNCKCKSHEHFSLPNLLFIKCWKEYFA